MFRKPIDNLKTNHRGTFVLTDNRFQPLGRMSIDRKLGAKGVDIAVHKAQAVSSSYALSAVSLPVICTIYVYLYGRMLIGFRDSFYGFHVESSEVLCPDSA